MASAMQIILTLAALLQSSGLVQPLDASSGALDNEPQARAANLDAAAGECEPLDVNCPQHPSDDEMLLHLKKAGQEASDGEERLPFDQWTVKDREDKAGIATAIDEDDPSDEEEYYEGSSVSSGGDHESGHGAVAAIPGEDAVGAAAGAGAALDENSDSQGLEGDGRVNVTSGGPETEKRKVPLREILLRLKPASLMDDDEREAAAAATATERGDQEPRVKRREESDKDDVITTDCDYGNSTITGQGLAFRDGMLADDTSGANTSKRAVCAATLTEEGVQLLNATGLQALVSPNANSTGRSQAAPCLLVFFFSHRCRFSSSAAPAMTALARALQGAIPVYGVDSVLYHSINAQFGVMGTPQLVLFHNGYSVAYYNASSFTPDLLTSFLLHYTDHRMAEEINIIQEDITDGPLPLKASPGGGWWLAASWVLLGGVASRCFIKSALCHRLVEAVLNSWREAEAQHQHQD